ncbi:MAG TPA: hypothetical protein VGK99_23320 [Acidobacteriota bacterium]|jgi:hypothetical protein
MPGAGCRPFLGGRFAGYALFAAILFLLISPSLAEKSSYYRYENVEAYLLRDGSVWRARDFGLLAFNPNSHRPVKVVFRVSAYDDQFLFCPRGTESCRPGPVSTHIILDRFSDDGKHIADGINTPGFVFPLTSLEIPYHFRGTVEVYSCGDVDPYTRCDPPQDVAEKEFRPSFYPQNINGFTSPEGRAAKPLDAFRDSWQRFDQSMDVYWDRDLRRMIAPFANLYRHLSDWRYGDSGNISAPKAPKR